MENEEEEALKGMLEKMLCEQGTSIGNIKIDSYETGEMLDGFMVKRSLVKYKKAGQGRITYVVIEFYSAGERMIESGKWEESVGDELMLNTVAIPEVKRKMQKDIDKRTREYVRVLFSEKKDE